MKIAINVGPVGFLLLKSIILVGCKTACHQRASYFVFKSGLLEYSNWFSLDKKNISAVH